MIYLFTVSFIGGYRFYYSVSNRIIFIKSGMYPNAIMFGTIIDGKFKKHIDHEISLHVGEMLLINDIHIVDVDMNNEYHISFEIQKKIDNIIFGNI